MRLIEDNLRVHYDIMTKTNNSDNTSLGEFATVDSCSLKGHLRCVYTTGKEVYRDGRNGKSTKHWWTMSYIGRACTRQWGKRAGILYEALFAIPHYIGIFIGNLVGYFVFLIFGPQNKTS
ncbi:hypothetical protein [Aquimarina sp. MMG016]|uniref:hypothetical protein n=1 Tax=Aquimarina sp. MMG016 TaxID=2822690 RepID=UPI001B39F6DF|nr:hypothetical protein [Aquimarina sp. MMG016]MBQ4819433.1 hypothetical protein [Aquimarina sp. MMG016]